MIYSEQEFRKDMERMQRFDSFFEIAFWVIAICVPIALLLFIMSCSAATSSEDPSFVGRWEYAAADSMNYLFNLQSKRTFDLSLYHSGAFVSRIDGKWNYFAGALHIYPDQCQSGPHAQLIACPPPDSIRALPNGDRWDLTFGDSAGITTYHFQRIN